MLIRVLAELRRGRLPGRAFMQAAVTLWLVRLAMWCLPFAMLRRHLESRRGRYRQRRLTGRPGDPARIARHLRLASRFVPRCTCLVRALAAEQLLAQSGHASLVRFGVASTLDAGFIAHAWVESDGIVLVGGDVSEFSELRRIQPRLP